MRIVNVKDYNSLEAVRELVTRPDLDEVQVSPAGMERTKQIFGKALSPQESVAVILGDIKQEGDVGLLRYIEKIDGQKLTPEELFVKEAEFEQAEALVSPQFLEALDTAITNIRNYHQKQLENSWFPQKLMALF